MCSTSNHTTVHSLKIVWKSMIQQTFSVKVRLISLQKRKFSLAFSREFCYTKAVGAWLSLVERFLGVEEVVGSNPVAPTSLVFSRLQGLSESLSDSSIFYHEAPRGQAEGADRLARLL